MREKHKNQLKHFGIFLLLAAIGFGIGYAITTYMGRLTPEQKAIQQGTQPELK